MGNRPIFRLVEGYSAGYEKSGNKKGVSQDRITP